MLYYKHALSFRLQSLGRPNTVLESISMADASHDSVEKRKKSPVRVTKPKPPGKRKKTSDVERESMDNRATRAWQKAFRHSEGDQPTENNNLHSAFPENDHHVRVEERQYITNLRTISKIRSTGSRSGAIGMVPRKRTTSSDVPISHAMLQQKAMDIARHMNIPEESFTASSGFISRFKDRHAIVSRIAAGTV